MALNHQDCEKEKILVIKLGALGDFVQALGPMASIRKHHSNADITLMTTAPFVSFGQACGYFDHIWDHKRPKWKDFSAWLFLRKKLNQEGFTRIYDLQNNDRTGLYFKLFAKKNRPEWVGIAKGASHRNTSPERTAGKAFDGHVQTLKLAGIQDVHLDGMRWIKPDIDRFRLEKPYILLVPGSAPQHLYKRWPVENYTALARILHGWGYASVIIGTQAEKNIAKEITESLPQAYDLTGQTTLFDIAALARNAATAIGNDTGPMHLIAPTGCPSFVLFSKHSNPARHAPIGKSVQTIQKDDLQDLSVDDVLKNIKARDFKKTLVAGQGDQD